MPCRPAVSNFRGRPTGQGDGRWGAAARRSACKMPKTSAPMSRGKPDPPETQARTKTRERPRQTAVPRPRHGSHRTLHWHGDWSAPASPAFEDGRTQRARRHSGELEAPAERPGRHSHFCAPAKGAPRAPRMRKPRNARRFQKPKDTQRGGGNRPHAHLPVLHDDHPINAGGARNFDLVGRLGENFIFQISGQGTPSAWTRRSIRERAPCSL